MTPLQAAGLLIAVALADTASTQTGWQHPLLTIKPPARSFHAMAYDLNRGTTVMFGGRSNGGPLADTWEWSGTNWIRRVTASSPAARDSHALALDLSRGIVVMFGGTTGTIADLDDTWEYDGQDWLQRHPVNKPSPRREARMASDVARSRVLLFGGGVGPGGQPLLADTWEWNGIDWSPRNPTTSPPARWSHGMTYDFAHGRIVMFGGAATGFTPLGDTWAWDGTDWTQLHTFQSPPPSMRTAIAFDSWRSLVCHFCGFPNGAHTWLYDGFSWRRDLRTFAPSIRSSFTLSHDILRSRTILFGGFTGGAYLDDTWEYDPGVVARWSPFGAGCAGTAGVPMLGPAGASQPVFGAVFRFELSSLPTTGIAVITIGFSAQQWNGIPLPWDLSSLGMPGCTMRSSPEFLYFAPVSAGRATLALPLPNDPGLVGVQFSSQAFVVEPGINAIGAIVSNAGVGVIGPF